MAIDWGGKAATSGATGLGQSERLTAAGRAQERRRLLAMADFYSKRGEPAEAARYRREARLFAPRSAVSIGRQS